MEPLQLAPAVIPHLVSRIVLCGGGGLDSRSSGIVFMISPRVAWIEHPIGGGNTSDRPIFHSRHEPHTSGAGMRVHLNCGDRNMSHASLALRFGTTALVALLAGRGRKPPRSARPFMALRAMRAFALDPSLRVAARCGDGRRRTAVQISRLNCQWVARHLDELPEWAPAVVEQWRATLALLDEGGAAAAGRLLDWAILHGIFTGVLAERGVSIEEVRRMNRKLALVERRLPVSEDGSFSEKILTVQDLRRSVVRAAFVQAGIDLAEVLRFFRLRAELAEIVTRYGEIGEAGLFEQLNGALRHRLPDVDDAALAHAGEHPPADTRAKLRGLVVRELGGSAAGTRMMVNWSRVTDCTRNRRLDLLDPFVANARWHDLPAPAPERRRAVPEPVTTPRATTRIFIEQLNEVRELYDRGRMDDAAQILNAIRPMSEVVAQADSIADFHRWDARVHSRLATGDAHERLIRGHGGAAADFPHVVDRVCIFRFEGLKPAAQIDAWISLGLVQLDSQPELLADAQAFLDHAGTAQLRRGQFSVALGSLERAMAIPPREARIEARTHADLADALRAAGRFAEAAPHIDAAERLQLDHRITGEHAELTCIARGRLAAETGERREAIKWLKCASAMLPPERAPVPFVRVHLLRARLPGGAALGATRRAIEEVRAARPALAACPLLAQVLEHWDAWTAGEPPPDGHPDKMFWGV